MYSAKILQYYYYEQKQSNILERKLMQSLEKPALHNILQPPTLQIAAYAIGHRALKPIYQF